MATDPPVFICAQCGGTFPFDPDDDDKVHAEAERMFGCRGDASHMVMVCDACYWLLIGFEGSPS